ncbi:MAG TPA: baseplate J/gp47 family protein [Anaerolineae bacterium]|nr:baseplate J/gp47 family protein [Anaerolineae bacterium]
MHLIHLTSDDDFVSIRDHLLWHNNGDRRYLLIPPTDTPLALTQPHTLALIRRYAHQNNIELAIISQKAEIIRPARAIGIPVFPSRAASEQRRSRRIWARARAKPLPGIAPHQTDEITPTATTIAKPATWQRWLTRYLIIFLLIVTTTLSLTALAYTIPGATVVLTPLTTPLRTTIPIFASTEPSQPPTNTNFYLPTQPRQLTLTWQASLPTTGENLIPAAAARGQIVFTNLTSQTLTIPEGTPIETNNIPPLRFQTTNNAQIPGAIGATLAVDIVATDAGPAGNQPANTIINIIGPLNQQLTGRNPTPTTGGAIAQVRTVATTDVTTLRHQVTQYLQALAANEIADSLAPYEFLATDTITLTTIHSQDFSHTVGEATDQLTLIIRATLTGHVVDTSLANTHVYNQLLTTIPPNFELVPKSLSFYHVGDAQLNDNGDIQFLMVAEGLSSTALPNLDDQASLLAGQPIADAQHYLAQIYPLQSSPAIIVRPNWFDRLPYWPARIQFQILAQEGSL